MVVSVAEGAGRANCFSTARFVFDIPAVPVLDKPGDLAGLLTNLEPNDVLFIDEIHRLSPVVEEYLYSAMEDFCLDMITGEGLGARTMKFQ